MWITSSVMGLVATSMAGAGVVDSTIYPRLAKLGEEGLGGIIQLVHSGWLA